MPKGFERCVAGGGRVRRVSGPSKRHGVGPGEYVNFCFLKGKSYRGEVHKAKAKAGGRATAARAFGEAARS